ncbi:hypothetical protein NliqN6_1717 [Naganishia liquefaciens]|uniref:Conserved oligomeric Golgi complex subunit 6 n=1 Tax=Naganishia liquefaciens TaxID=104408 RepID=A0A8H3YDD6_9TREE|nr:hypothetical protein NliqN6_1717 [Naganishia liquefaciens]
MAMAMAEAAPRPRPPGPPPPRTNPISLRLWKIISTSAGPGAFDDRASHDALQIVSERYCGPPPESSSSSSSSSRVSGKSKGKRERVRAQKRGKGRGDVGAHWLGAEAVRRAGLELGGGGATGRSAQDSDPVRYESSDDEAETSSDQEDSENSSSDGGETSSDPGRQAITTPPASSIRRPGILSRQHSSTTSVRPAHAAASSVSPALITGATNAKRFFKRDLETGLVEGSMRFLAAFEKVDEQLQALRAHMHEMRETCDAVQGQMDEANAGTSGLVARANALRSQQQFAHMRQEISQLFLARFTLTPDEVALLRDPSSFSHDSVGKPLFDVMDKVQRIRRDCRALFELVGAEAVATGTGTGTGGQEGGAAEPGEIKDGEGIEGRDPADPVSARPHSKEIMATTTEHMTDAYEKLYRWVMFDFRTYSRDAQLEVSEVTREAVKRLRERRDLLDDALNILTSTRQSFLLQSFIEALTRGGPNGLPRPIELHAHDPTRYVGDMLAWVHQATAGEREFLDALFDVTSYRRRMVGEARGTQGGEASEEEVLARTCLDKALEGLARPLKVRIQHTVKSQEGIIVTYRIANLVQFYLVTMQHTIGKQALLTQALQEIFDSAHDAFLETLAAQGRSLLRFLHPPEPDLAPPLALRESSATLHEIMAVYDTSLVEEDDREADFAEILQAGVDPLVKMCQHMVDIWPKASEWDKNVFLTNCGLYLQHVLEPYSFTRQRQIQLQDQIDGWVGALTQEHYRELLEQSGLYAIVQAMADETEVGCRPRPEPDPAPADLVRQQTPLSRLPGAEAKAITQAMKTFDTFLASLDILTSPRLSLLTSARIASDIHRFALENMASDYDKIYAAVMDKDNKYEFPSTLLSRHPEDVYMLLGIDRL